MHAYWLCFLKAASKPSTLADILGHVVHAILVVMLQVEKLLTEVETLGTFADTDTIPAETLDSRTRLYERVATEVSRLKYYLVKGEGLPNLQQLQPRADSAVEQLSGLLQQALSLALKSHNQPAVMHCLQAYAVIGDTTDAEQVSMCA